MLVKHVCLQGGGVASNTWNVFKIDLAENRSFRSQCVLTSITFYSVVQNLTSPNLLGNVLELKFGNEIVCVKGETAILSNLRFVRFESGLIRIPVGEVFSQRKSINVEYRFQCLRIPTNPVLPSSIPTLPYNDIWYPILMTMNSQTNTYNDIATTGTYAISASSASTGIPITRAVDRNPSSAHVSATSRYSTTTGAYLGTNSVNGIFGEWFRITFPAAIYINGVMMYQQLGSARTLDFSVVGDLTTTLDISTNPYRYPYTGEYVFYPVLPGFYSNITIITITTGPTTGTKSSAAGFSEIAAVNRASLEHPTVDLTFEIQ